jgi:tripartite-type tricarboxylate transporter receptor subunit TctC
MQFQTMKSYALCALALVVAPIHAQTYPTKPITLVAGYSAGGSVDLAARTIAPELGKRLGQSIVVENVGGVGGSMGAQTVASAPDNGYTLLLGTSAEIAVASLISPVIRYNGMTDFKPLGLIGTQPIVIVSAPEVPANTTQELLSLLRKSPGKYSYGSAGSGSLPHLSGELFRSRSKTEIVHIPYKGAAPMITELLGRQIELGFLVLSSAMPQIKAGKLKAIAVTESARHAQLPNVAALSETKELAGFDVSVFFGVFAHSGTPAAIQAKVATALAEAMKQPEVRAKLTDAGFTVRALDAAASAKFIAQQAKIYRDVVEQSKIRE